MAKPSERNRMMRDIAGVAMDEELTALRRKRADLARLAVQLDDMRWAAERFREQAEAFCREYAEPRSYITGALGMAPRERKSEGDEQHRHANLPAPFGRRILLILSVAGWMGVH